MTTPEDVDLVHVLDMAFRRIRTLQADHVAMQMVISALLEQIPHDRSALFEAMTRRYDALQEVMERRAQPPEWQQEELRAALDRATEMFCRRG